MRQIKFRAWNKEEKIMSEPFTLWGITDGFIRFDEERLIFGFEDDVEVMQYTSLKDKNGKEIYEGDILLSPFKNHYLVEWDKEAVRFAFIGYGKILVKGHYPVWQFIKAYEVIGNIYENPELLK